MQIKVSYDVDTIFREIVYVRNKQASCKCSAMLCDPQNAINLSTGVYRVCASCGGLVYNGFDQTDETKERDEWDSEAYMHDNEPSEPRWEDAYDA